MNNRIENLFFAITLCFGLGVSSCDNSQSEPNGYIATTLDGTSTMILKGYQDASKGYSVFKPEGYESSFYIKDKKFMGSAYDFVFTNALPLKDMASYSTIKDWKSNVVVFPNSTYWVRYSSSTKFVYLKMRVAYIDGNNVAIEYKEVGSEDIPNENANVGFKEPSTTFYEIPKLNTEDVYVDHYVTVDGKDVLNYALEWNAAKKHSRWVAYSFDKTTCQSNVSRTNAWAVDPSLSVDMQVTENDHKSDAFDKGHICGSADRLYSKEANEQTFFYSNMSPMSANFNQVYWAGYEDEVRNWGHSCAAGTYDKVYVVKGGTIDNLNKNFIPTYSGDKTGLGTDAEGYTVHGLACPKYYFMAILTVKNGVYHALGFYLEHKDGYSSPSVDEIKSNAISIDDLQKKTGIDFFCNLPDNIENAVEASVNTSDWTW